MKPSEYIGAIIIIGIIVNQLVFLAGTVLNQDSFHQYMSAVLSGVLVEQTNEVREDKNLIKLKTDPLLQEAAQLKANDMAEKGYFAHVTPDGKQPWYWLSAVSYPYIRAGENLAVNFVDSSQVTSAWMDSPTHRENILNGNYTHVGIATAQGKHKGKDAIYVVQFFATPDFSKSKYATAPNIEEKNIKEDEVVNVEEVAVNVDVNEVEIIKDVPIKDTPVIKGSLVYSEEELLEPFVGVLGTQNIATEIYQADEIYIRAADKFLSVPFKVTVGIFTALLLSSFLYGLRGIHIRTHLDEKNKLSINSKIFLEISDYRYLKQGFLLVFVIIIFTYVSSLLLPTLYIG